MNSKNALRTDDSESIDHRISLN